MKFKFPRFRTHLGLTAVLAALAIGFVLLGNWQRERAHAKHAEQAAFDSAPVVASLEDALPDWTRTVLDGRLDPVRHVLLDNKLHGGRPGVHVLTPFELASGGDTLLVNRGWLPLPPDRSSLPDVQTPTGPVTLAGRLAPLSRPGVVIGEPVQLDKDTWPQLVVYPEHDRIEAALGTSLYPKVLYLDADAAGGFSGRDWTPFTMGPDRHRAYAVQWYGLALAAATTWLVLGFNAGRKAHR